MNEKMISIMLVLTEPEAEILRSLLASYEIDCAVIADTGIGQGFGGYSSMSKYEIFVRPNDAERAREILAQYENGELE